MVASVFASLPRSTRSAISRPGSSDRPKVPAVVRGRVVALAALTLNGVLCAGCTATQVEPGYDTCATDPMMSECLPDPGLGGFEAPQKSGTHHVRKNRRTRESDSRGTSTKSRFCDSIVNNYVGSGSAGDCSSSSEEPAIDWPTTPIQPSGRGRCVNVTSIDGNYFNDMLCTRNDGSQFYTDYAGANAFRGM